MPSIVVLLLQTMPLLARLEHIRGFCGHMNPGDLYTRTCKYQNETIVLYFMILFIIGFQFMPLQLRIKNIESTLVLFFFVASGELEIRHAHG